MIEWVIGGSTTLLSLTLGYLLWRETRKRARAEKDLDAWVSLCAKLTKIKVTDDKLLEEKENRIRELEASLAAADPSELFDSLFGSRTSSRDPE